MKKSIIAMLAVCLILVVVFSTTSCVGDDKAVSFPTGTVMSKYEDNGKFLVVMKDDSGESEIYTINKAMYEKLEAGDQFDFQLANTSKK